MTRGLVIARVGRTSLHRCWIDAGTPRAWDLYLSPYEDIGPQDDLDCRVGDVIPGPKWTGLGRLLHAWDGWRDHDPIWLPDDDILASQNEITRLFETGRALDFQLFAPALHERSHYAHFIAMRNASFFARRVGFVEIMVPCFRRATLERLLPTFALSATGWGFGLDAAWPKLLDHQGLGIVDDVPVVHTRPVGTFKDPGLRRRVLQESDDILARFDCEQRLVTFAGIGPDLRDARLTPEELLAALVRGWQYLFERDAKALRFCFEQQRGLLPASPYPVAGLPSGPDARAKSGS